MRKRATLLLLTLLCALPLFAHNETATRAITDYNRFALQALVTKDTQKEAAIEMLRQKFRTNDHRGHIVGAIHESSSELLALLDSQGRFTDMIEEENRLLPQMHTNGSSNVQGATGNMLGTAWLRIWKIAAAYRNDPNRIECLTPNYMQAILHYGELEISRPNVGARFLRSCFDMASAASATYYCLLSVMDDIENEKITNPRFVAVADMLKTVALQAWTQPFRGDDTDYNVVSIERFRHHVWWVGANGLAYRPILQVAAMFRSIPMNDVLAAVAQGAISYTSQQTLNSAFWTEGLTADGAGWGHGMQCCVWGYPVQGVSAAVNFITQYKGTPWVAQLSRENKKALWVLLRGTSWFYHNGYTLPAIGRTTMQYNPTPGKIGSESILNNLISNWSDSFTKEEQAELLALQKEMQQRNIYMAEYPEGDYHGTRYYFNNDNLIKRAKDYHIFINMNSSRCDGSEMDAKGNDRYNFFLTDGATYLQREGNEYARSFGAYDITRMPGVTAREGMEQLVPKTDWRGYKGMHNFAGGATLGGENAVCGVHYEKAKGALDTPMLYNVESYKSYFFFGDYLLALGAGVTNKDPELAGTIRTSIEQVIQPQGGTYLYNKEGEQELTVGKRYHFVENNETNWVVQRGGFAYTVLPQFTHGEALFTVEKKMTDWAKISGNRANQQAKDSEINLFSAWIDHGQKTLNDTYGYVIYAGEGNPEELPFTVIRNDKQIQAAMSREGDLLQAVIYNPKKTITAGSWNIAVNRQAIVLLQRVGEREAKISVCDPTMNYNLREILLTINGTEIIVPLPQGDQAGKPAVLQVAF